MHFTLAIVTVLVLCASSGSSKRSLYRRQVPQEHSHEAILRAMRDLVPAGTAAVGGEGTLPDVVFGLLANPVANANAPGGDGICLQQITSDTGISRANGDKTKIATALKYRALERNTPGVGKKSDLCTKTPKNAILNGLTQHQDAASDGAAANNKNVEITLAQKLNSVGVDPQQALETATFAPGNVNDNTFKGNTCDDANDAAGCIVSQKLARPAATADDIKAAVAGGGKVPASTAPATQAPAAPAAPPAAPAAAAGAAKKTAAQLIASINAGIAKLEKTAADPKVIASLKSQLAQLSKLV